MVPDCREALCANVNPGDVGVAGVAVARAVFSPIRTTTTSGEQEVVSETDTDAPKLVPSEALPSRESPVEAPLTVNSDAPELPAWMESPEYTAVTVTVPPDAGAAYVMVHELEEGLFVDREQFELLKVPPLPPSPHETEPVGVNTAPVSASFVDAVKVSVLPAVTVDGFGVTPVLLVLLFIINADEPRLPPCKESPA